jgi:hypothetical protein
MTDKKIGTPLITSRRLHKVIGIVLLLPFLGWAVTGLVFFIKPGYAGAYELLRPKTYSLNRSFLINPQPSWMEYRCLRTVLGDHLLARTGSGWEHLDPTDMRAREVPGRDGLKLLLDDAISVNPSRYGRILTITDRVARTDTGIEIKLDWNSLTLQQKGRDTEVLDFLYRIHYLQWTGYRIPDRILGVVGLILIVSLSALGLRLALTKNHRVTTADSQDSG